MMKYCKYFVPLVALACTVGFANTAKAELGACCAPDGVCYDDHSYDTCTTGKSGDYQGDGTTCAEGCPDCDCDGDFDAMELADCVSYCVANMAPLTEQQCLDLVCDTDGDGAPDSSAPVGACPTTNENVPWGNRCCDQLTGLHLPIDDGWDCTVDVCHADGSVSNTPDDGFCTAAHSGMCWTAFCDPPNAAWPDGCDWDYDVVGTPCTGNGVGECTEADTCDGAGACDNHDLDNYTDCTPDANDCTVDQCWSGTCGHWPEVNGVLCGNPPDPNNPCDAQDTCGGTYPAAHANNGVCMDRHVADGPNAGCDDSDPCTTDVCTSGACDNSGAAPDGTACGGPRSGECDLPDSCCAGVCVDIVADSTTKCGDDTGEECDADDYCPGGILGCGHGNIYDPLAVPDQKDCPDLKDGDGTWCDADHAAGPAPTECSARDKCLAGVCEANHEPDTTPCTDWDGNDCTFEFCDGAGACGHPPVPAGTACGDPGDTRCDNPDTCDGAGTCEDNHEAVGFMCRAAADVCDVDDYCDDAQACLNDKKAAGTLCRAPGAGGGDPECDVEEVCDGVNNACPTDLYVSYMTACETDYEQCTHDYCSGGKCYHIELADWTPCPVGDGDVCTTRDRCRTGLGCVGDQVNDCDDSDLCTIDACDQDHPDADEFGCYHTYGAGGNCDLLVKIELTGSDPITRSYQKGCFTAEVYAMDASAEGNGLNCVFVDLEFGETSCPLSVMDLGNPINEEFDFQVEIDPAFPDFNRWYVEPPFDVLDFGGCTNMSEYGVGVWVPLGTVEIIAPNNECCADLDIVQATFEESSLIGLGTKVAHEAGESVDEVCMDCWGDLYNCWDVPGKFINAGDLSLFAECWDECTPACAAFNYDMSVDGCVGEGDLAFFATAWQEFVCAGGIIIPAVQMHCDGYDWGPGGAAGTANGVMLLDNGNVMEVQVPPASVEMIKSFGLTVPERLVAPPDNDRLTPKANKRPGVRSR